jgi:hypothetical protein
VRASKVGLLLLILGFGASVETAWFVENRLDLGPSGCRVLGGRFYGPSFSFDSQSTHPVAAGTAVEVDNAFGAVRVKKGAPGEVGVQLHKVVFRRTEGEAKEFSDRIRLSAVADGPTLRVSTNRDELDHGRRDEVGFETHLELTVPPETPVKVKNEHGEVEIADAARAEVWASYEAVRVERVAGPVSVDLRHGDATVMEVGGDLTLTNRYGRSEVRDVQGRAQLDTEHGDLALTNVGPSVLRVTHGSVTVQTVRGSLEVHGQHAGLSVAEVSGDATIESSFNEVQVHKVGGQARIKVEHGQVELEDAAGPAKVEASFGDVRLLRVAGPVEVDVKHGGLQAEALEKGAVARVSGEEVVLDGFAGPVDLDVERAGARLVPRGPLAAPVTVRTRHGGIELEVPPGSRMALEARAQDGEVDVDVAGLSVQRVPDPNGGSDRVMGRLGDGANRVLLETEHGGVRVQSTTAVAQKP